MNGLLCLAFLFAVASATQVDFLSSKFIDSINQKQPRWVAGRNFPENTTYSHLRRLAGSLGVHPDPNYKPQKVVHQFNPRDIPDTFDGRNTWSFCESLTRIRDQGRCGSCWAFAAVESLSDRICIHSSGAEQVVISAEELLSCCSLCGDCSGGYMMPAFDYYINEGLVSGGDLNSNEGCEPYSALAHNYGVTPRCLQSCSISYSKSYQEDKHYGSRDYVVDNSIDQIQYEIIKNGPLIVNFEVFEDFYNYISGVYHHVEGVSVGFHVVKIIGWGTENGAPYWLIANSWGSNWGENGFFKMLRGSNESGIENYPYAALPR